MPPSRTMFVPLIVRTGGGGVGISACVKIILLDPMITRAAIVMMSHLETTPIPAFDVTAVELCSLDVRGLWVRSKGPV